MKTYRDRLADLIKTLAERVDCSHEITKHSIEDIESFGMFRHEAWRRYTAALDELASGANP